MASLAALHAFVRSHKWWQNAIFFAGLVALITVFSVAFLGADGAPGCVWTHQPLGGVDSPQFAESLSQLVNAPVERGGSVEVLDNGDGFLPALLRDIRHARETVNILVYVWEDGRMSDQVLDALTQRQYAGVAVRVLLDGLGGDGAPGDRFRALEQAGGRVERYRDASLGSWTRLHRRTHRRAIVIDGAVGFVGGMGISDKWLGGAQDEHHWRDTMFRVTGPMARRLQAAFVGSWESSSGEILVLPRAPLDAPVEAGVERFIHHAHSPADDDRSMAYFYLLPILAARERIYLTTPYFVPDGPLQQALRDQARAGVDVRLLVPGPRADHTPTRFAGRNSYQGLLDAGVQIYEYGPTFLHSKVAIVDGRWCIIGSPNLNSRSRRLDEENALAILDGTLGRQLEQRYFADIARSSAVDPGAWRRRSPLLRLMQFSARD